MINPVSKENALSHYKWGDNCDGWDFVRKPEVSIKQELMPPGTSEKLHAHQFSAQFFFVIKGDATFLIEDKIVIVKENNGLQINAGEKHKIMNKGKDDLEFILFSQPSTQNDRINYE